MNLFLIDGIGPFFRNYARQRINWSKIPFDNLEKNGEFDEAGFGAILGEFRHFVDIASGLGFNGITLDDLAHLTRCETANQALTRKLRKYRDAYRQLFEIAANRGMTVYITTDVIFEPAGKPGLLLRRRKDTGLFLRDACVSLFSEFPSVGGVIMRIGECDGLDVRGDFISHLAIRTPQQARKLIRCLLPAFEQNSKLLIFRTWTVGAHPIGDLIWNSRTFDRTFGGIDSPNLVLSMKYGETDFFRYLPLNKLFHHSSHRKIIEFQTRREYEGFGEFPSFVGWDYEEYMRQLRGARNVIGAWVWCQTGGWAGFNRRTFLDPGGVWNEINTVATLRIVKDGLSADDAVRKWAAERLGADTAERLLVLLRLSCEAVMEALYIDEFARSKLFFRRLRVPPLLTVFWDQIIVNHSMRKLLNCFVHDAEGKVAQSTNALGKIRSMQALAAEIGLPAADFEFQYDTFEILAVAREYYFSEFNQSIVDRLHALKAAYERKYSSCYAVRLDFTRFRLSKSQLKVAFTVLFRSERGYRLVDRLLLLRLISLLSPLLPLRRRASGDRLIDQAMGLRTVLK